MTKLFADAIISSMKGGSGSGDYGHEGRPGEVGGSGTGGAYSVGDRVSYNGKLGKISQVRTGSTLHGKPVYPPTGYDIELDNGKSVLVTAGDFHKIKSEK